MSDVPSFSEDAVQAAIKTAQDHYNQAARQTASGALSHDDGHLALLSECISVDVENGKVCIKLPLGIGKVCIPIPVKYNGQVAQACLHTCTTFGIPTGVKVTVSIAGIRVVKKTFGKC